MAMRQTQTFDAACFLIVERDVSVHIYGRRGQGTRGWTYGAPWRPLAGLFNHHHLYDYYE
jgi:hypothetical protein